MDKVNLSRAYASFDEPWSPRIIASVNDYDVKIAHVMGGFPEHVHADTDEYFHVVAGRMRLDLPDRSVVLEAGDVFTVPRGVPHRPSADPGTRLLLIEPRGTVNTGNPDTGTAGVPLG